MKAFWKKKLPAFLLAALMLAGTAVPAAADDPPPGHNFSSLWSKNETEHWHDCTDPNCTEKTAVGAHEESAWQDAGNGTHHKVCRVCGYEMESGVHHPSLTVTATIPATCAQTGKNYYACTDGCGYQREEIIPALPHTLSGEWKSNDTEHWHPCAVCGQEYPGSKAAHTYEANYTSDATYHWQRCTTCNGTSAKVAHVDANNDGVCDVCVRGGLPVSAKYTVTFINSGSTYGTPQSVNKDGLATVPGTPSKSASYCTYSFKGWTTSNPGTAASYYGQTVYTAAQVAATKVTANMVWYAVYTLSAANQSAALDLTGTGESSVGSSIQSKLNGVFAGLTGRNFVNVSLSGMSTYSYGTLYANSSRTDLARTYTYSGGSYPIASVYFVPSGTRGTSSVTYTATDGYSTVQGTLSITSNGNTGYGTTINYTVQPGERVSMDRADFNRVYQSRYSDTVRWVEFTSVTASSSGGGTFYYNYGRSDQKELSLSAVDDYSYYYSSSSYGSYPIDDLSFLAVSGTSKGSVTVNFRAYYSSSRYVDGEMEIQISGAGSGETITYKASTGEAVSLDISDFRRVFQNGQSGYEFRFVTFLTTSAYDQTDGLLYYNYGGRSETAFNKNNYNTYIYYVDNSKYGDYPLGEMSFVTSSSFSDNVRLPFRAYYDAGRYVDGVLEIQAEDTAIRGDIRYNTTGGTNVQINPNDIARFMNQSYSGSVLQSVKLGGVPDTGTLYYNYYGVSSYGTTGLKLTSGNCGSQLLYFSPSGANQYALSELTYVPTGNNYCTTIPFTAYGSGNRTAQGTILISVNSAIVQDVYGATPMNTSVTFPADAIYKAVSSAASGASMSSLQLLELPASRQGTVYVGTGSVRAATGSRYVYSGSSGSGRIGDLRFMPASGFTGSVEMPYVAYNSAGKAITSGRFCLGIVGGLKSYRDVGSSVWCYKYVAELSDAKVIDGYPDGYFKPDKTVTYGQALKLIMLAADYKAQSPTGKHPFSGYLSRAKSDGLLTGVKESDLDRPISRLAVAQITAKSMKLNLSSLSSVKPFTDTGDVYVQALSAAGIVEGYFSNGTSTFKPSNTMTRGQISAVVWRMNRAE
ncbi:S-layer homology domain-containing protein [Oscillibacter sp. GMB15532]|uniref:S-layer homology domain-containing protein n=1 Tax=Oscillibacter sp. GMB15532 TaxID=3230022 RepID=UPI0034DFBCB8